MMVKIMKKKINVVDLLFGEYKLCSTTKANVHNNDTVNDKNMVTTSHRTLGTKKKAKNLIQNRQCVYNSNSFTLYPMPAYYNIE